MLKYAFLFRRSNRPACRHPYGWCGLAMVEKQGRLFLEPIHHEAREEAVKRSTLKFFLLSEAAAASVGVAWVVVALLERNVWDLVKSFGFFMWMLDGARRDYKALYGKPLVAPSASAPTAMRRRSRPAADPLTPPRSSTESCG